MPGVFRRFPKYPKKAQELEDLTPSAQAWLRIKSRLKTEEQTILTPQPRKQDWFSFLFFQPKLKYALSSALLLAVIVGAVTLGIQYWKGREALRGSDPQKYTFAKLEEAERHYQLAIKALYEAASSQESYLDPQVAEIFRVNLALIDSSILACKQAVLSEPENLEVRNYLLSVYKEKVDLLDIMIATKSASFRERELRTTL